jgi:NAD(P)-dependent dehydrogenase (short-subunit alcohol dehydrogenase family)
VPAARGGALVTGGAKRVGRRVSLALARAGYAVAVHHRTSPEAAETLVREIEAEGGRAAALAADLSDDAALTDLPARATAAVGPLSLLVNNASHFEDDRIETLTPESWAAHMGPNLWAPIRLTQVFARSALDAPEAADPNVVNILDQRVLHPNPQFFSYTLAKTALHTATRTLAQGLAPRIRVNGVAPGPTLPSIHQDEALFAAEVAGVALQRPSAPEDIAAAVVYLASSRAVTGQVIAVDGGQHLAWLTPDIVSD